MIGYTEVNKALDEVIAYLKEHENAWNETRTLKLHDVSYHGEEILDKYPLVKEEYKEYDLFNWFCEDEYNNFTEWMEENHIDDCRNYIGRTSSFYLTDLHDNSIGNVITELIEKVYNYVGIDFSEDGHIEPFTATEYYTEAELIDEAQGEMRYIASGDFLKDTKKYLADAIEIADYIDTFKENQVANFEEYIQFKNELLEEAAEKEAEEEKTFTDKYFTAINNLTVDIERMIRQTGCTLADARRILSKSFEGITLDGIEEVAETA